MKRSPIPMSYRGYLVERRYRTILGPPQPDEFEWYHPEYDGPGDPRSGWAKSVDEAKREIDFLEDEIEFEEMTSMVIALTEVVGEFVSACDSMFLKESCGATAVDAKLRSAYDHACEALERLGVKSGVEE